VAPPTAKVSWNVQIGDTDADTTTMRFPSISSPRLKAALSRTDIELASSLIGSGRHTAVPALRGVVASRPTSILRQAASLASGSILIGVAVALMVEANLGLSPYDVLSQGVGQQLGLTLGQSGWLLAAILFGAATLLGHRPSLWGVSYVLANGVAIDATSHLLSHPTMLVVRVTFVAAAILLMAAGISLVVHSGTTGGPFELLMKAGEDRGFPLRTTRSILDVGVLALGIMFGGTFGAATLVFAATMGLVLQTIHQALVDHRVGRGLRRQEATVPTKVTAGV